MENGEGEVWVKSGDEHTYTSPQSFPRLCSNNKTYFVISTG
ncbi:hypothetical protein AAAC51_22035 [Priestia megaterium]